MAAINNLFKTFFCFVLVAMAVFFYSHSQTHPLPVTPPHHSSVFSSYNTDQVDSVTTRVMDNQASAAVDKVSPSVVSIYGYQNVDNSSASKKIEIPLFHTSINIFPAEQVQVDAGTGFVVDSNGYILTSNHVVSATNTNYTVILPDGTSKPARIVYQNSENDVSILKISGSGFPTAALGDSSTLTVGEIVLGMGNALGEFSNFTSIGAVVDFHKDITPSNSQTAGQKISDLFESTMQLYPGDSGGPTFDLAGNVVGINDAIAVNQPNISFSIPINTAKEAIAKVVGGK
jgi:S1-C subfamily serine protease